MKKEVIDMDKEKQEMERLSKLSFELFQELGPKYNYKTIDTMEILLGVMINLIANCTHSKESYKTFSEEFIRDFEDNLKRIHDEYDTIVLPHKKRPKDGMD